ncbi:HAL/PAL/TAL family ammonia-lyase [Acetobacter sp.]|jgi:histidine ammonia-lyase|uniref:HAL/PAL/TAL family ammonia-lyase n=1 Tax=Acetobacter sp. TaxID=440 RepID=UPI0025C42878|nr:histidine ammonia-lyase [Acetobacter sp.]MCH4089782.1 histidine ammonia-lyase [Acetobacter sp.]MCI1298478.1 histidine ammonia-lyase [Acetobacter sp.]
MPDTRQTLLLDAPLVPRQVWDIAQGTVKLDLSSAARLRIRHANTSLRHLIEGDTPIYGLNTGVGGLSEQRISAEQQAELSRKILFSHAVGVGRPLTPAQTRAIMACAVNSYALGYTGVRETIPDRLIALLNSNCLPVVPSEGSVGYLVHMAHIALALIGHGTLQTLDGPQAASLVMQRLGFAPLQPEAKEGLALVNGLACATGLGCLSTHSLSMALHWADRIAAATFDIMGGQRRAFDPRSATLRNMPGGQRVSARLRALTQDSLHLAARQGSRTQDALSLRAIPHIHGSVHDALEGITRTLTQELGSLSDNPAIIDIDNQPRAFSQAHAVGASLARVMDEAAVAAASLGAVAERRLDRMVNPLVSPFPAFLPSDSGTGSGFMIAQYTACALVGQNRRMAAPASLDGGITSGLQEDILVHATPSALKAQTVVDNTRTILAIELLALCQAIDLASLYPDLAPKTQELYTQVRAEVPLYQEDHPLADDITAIANWLGATHP